MIERFRGRLTWTVLFVLLLIAVACAPTPTSDPVSSASAVLPPTVSPPTVSSLSVSSPLASLTAKEIIVRRFRGGNSVAEVQKEDEIDIQEDDRISVEDKGRGLLKFQDNLEVEIFHDTELKVSGATLDPEELELEELELDQVFGTTRVKLNQEAGAGILIKTEHADISSIHDLDSNTDIVIYQGKLVTCLVTFSGEIEVEAEDEVVNVGPGEASCVSQDKPPSTVICADVAEVEQWVDQYRNAEEVLTLDKIVAAWSQEPCTTETADAVDPTVTPLPPTETAVAIPLAVITLPTSDMMVNISSGQYEIGDPEADEFHLLTKQIAVDGFWIDQFEVNNAQYKIFMDENDRTPPVVWPGGVLPVGKENHPVKGVTWDDASAFCIWVNKRLPSESEWEIAARGPGPDPALYPWGSDPGAGEQVFGLPLTDTYEVGTVSFNRSPFDVFDMAGNVWEWVDEPYSPVQEGDFILRGGRHGLLKDMAYRQLAASNSERFVPFAGFRCAADQVEGE